MKKEALRVTATIPVAPTTLYFAWIDSAHHSAMTGGTAKIDPTVGAKYSAWNGYITGKLLILDLGRRIVMSWRTTEFPRDAADSRVEVHFETLGTSTRILILQTEIPEGQSERYKQGWNDKYITPMRSYFSKFLPDPRNPPVRRPPPPPMDDDEEEEEVPVKGKGKLGAKGAPAKSGPGVHKVDGKAGKAAKAAPVKAPPPPAKGKPAPKAAAPAKKAPPPPPAKKPAPPAKKPAPAAKKPAPKPVAKKPAPAAKKPAPKKPAPKPAAAKGKKKR